MDVVRDEEIDLVTIGPCPGCELWQLEYTQKVASEFIRLVVREEAIQEFWREEPVALATNIETDASEWHAVIEDALREHLDECPHLRRLIEAEGMGHLLYT